MVTQNTIIIQGEKTFKLVTLSIPKEGGLSLETVYDHSDKSLDKLIHISWDSNGYFTCLYAHNWIEKYNQEGLVFKQFCSEECILYAGDIKN